MAAVPGMTDIPDAFNQGEFEGSLKNEKRALLAAIAEHGTSGAIAFEKAKQDALEFRSSSNEQAAARGGAVHDVAALRARAFEDEPTIGGVFLDDITQASVSHGRELDRLAAANAAFLDQTAAAGAITAAELARMRAAAAAGSGSGGGAGLLPEAGALSLQQLMQISDEEGLSDQEAVQLARDVGAPAEWEQTLFNYRNPAQDPEGLANVGSPLAFRAGQSAPAGGFRPGSHVPASQFPGQPLSTTEERARAAARAGRANRDTSRKSIFDRPKTTTSTAAQRVAARGGFANRG